MVALCWTSHASFTKCWLIVIFSSAVKAPPVHIRFAWLRLAKLNYPILNCSCTIVVAGELNGSQIQQAKASGLLLLFPCKERAHERVQGLARSLFANTLKPRTLELCIAPGEAKLSDSVNCWCAIVVAGEKWSANWGSKSKSSFVSLTCLLPNSPQKGLGFRALSLSSPIL